MVNAGKRVQSSAFKVVGLLAAALSLTLVSEARNAQQSARIAGTIVTAGAAPQPVARATVTIAGASLDRRLVTVTDAAGRFVFEEVPPGLITLTASKPTYLTMAFGQSTPGRGSGLPVSVAPGQRIDNLTWAMPKAAAISGRVLDDRSQPFANVPVHLMRYEGVDDERRLVAGCCSTRTDGEGLYRIAGIPPGSYLVAALPPGDYVYHPNPWTTNPPAARPASGAEMTWAMRQLAGGTAAAEPPPARPVTYTRMFYGATPDPARATLLTLATGDDRRGVDIAMTLLPSADIEGRVIGPDGQPVRNAMISLGGAGWSLPQGTFAIRNLTPGRYPMTFRNPGGTLWAEAAIDVRGEDVSDLEIRLQPAASVTGRVVFESTTTPRPTDFSSVRLTLRPSSSGFSGTRIGPDGTFTLSGLDPGRYRLVPAVTAARGGAPSPWTLKSAVVAGRDAADLPFEIRAGESITDVVVTFTDVATELSGTLFNADGLPAPGFYVVVMPAEEALRLPGARRIPAPARAATNGSFRFAGLPPGDYLLAALTAVDVQDLGDAGFLADLAAGAIKITLAPGERKIQDIRFAARADAPRSQISRQPPSLRNRKDRYP